MLYQIKTAFGDALSGQVVYRKGDDVIEITIEEYADAYLSLAFMGGGKTTIWLSLGTFGYSETEALHAKWNAWLDVLLPAPAEAK